MTENDLCNEFIAIVKKHLNWVCYPETRGWDMLFVRSDGLQIGVEAKLRANIDVLAQTISRDHATWPGNKRHGPSMRYVLVPKASTKFVFLASELHIGVFELEHIKKCLSDHWYKKQFINNYFEYRTKIKNLLWTPKEQYKLPEITYDIPAGVPSPKTVSPWKISAVKLSLLLMEQGYLTAHDFKKEGINFDNYFKRFLMKSDERLLVQGKKRKVNLIKWKLANPLPKWIELPHEKYNFITKKLNEGKNG